MLYVKVIVFVSYGRLQVMLICEDIRTWSIPETLYTYSTDSSLDDQNNNQNNDQNDRPHRTAEYLGAKQLYIKSLGTPRDVNCELLII